MIKLWTFRYLIAMGARTGLLAPHTRELKCGMAVVTEQPARARL